MISSKVIFFTVTGLIALVNGYTFEKGRVPLVNHARRTTDTSYEYVIVGSGPGGGPLAARLAIAGHSVLLLESGDDQGLNINYQVPAFQGKSTEDPLLRLDFWVNHYPTEARAARDPKMNWDTPGGGIYTGLNPPAGSKMKGILYPRASTLGGCGSHNALITIYPHESDWNNLVSITGDQSWSPQNMRSYFEKMEDCEYLPNTVVGHGFGGWLHTSVVQLTAALKDLKLLEQLYAAATTTGAILGPLAGAATGLTGLLSRDVNGQHPGRDSQAGLFQIPLTADAESGIRIGPRDFLVATANAVNSDGSKKYPLTIQLNTLVTKVIFDQSAKTPKATGVEFITGRALYSASPLSNGAPGTPGTAKATREVIVSAGAFNTPQLLKLSGIGPAAELASFHIPLIADLPGVGTNMQDRYESGVTSVTPTPFALTAACTFNNGTTDPCLAQWKANVPLNRGPYGSNAFAGTVLLTSTVAPSTDTDLFVFGGPVAFHGYYPNYADVAVQDARHWTWAVLKAHTQNTAGTVTLASTDPRDPPIINFNYFDTGTTANGADKNDLEAVAQGIALGREIAANLAATPGAAPFSEVLPGVNITGDAVKTYIEDNTWGHHASCTCKIGADDDPMAVLDSSFRVRGVQGLRVVDASIFPRIPGIFICVPVYMISEKAADVILGAL